MVTLLDAGEANGGLYVVLEYVDGGSLAELIARSAPLPIDDVLRILGDVLAGLATVHAAGLVHRDVKPGNVLLTSDGRAKLADFGIARWLDDIEASLTSPGTVIGTERYMAPERLAGSPVTVASDLYSVAVVAFEMLGGQEAPGRRRSGRDMAAELLRRRPETPMALVAAMQRALAADPDDRFADRRRDGRRAHRHDRADPHVGFRRRPHPRSGPATRSKPTRRWPLVGAVAALLLAAVVVALAATTATTTPPRRRRHPPPRRRRPPPRPTRRRRPRRRRPSLPSPRRPPPHRRPRSQRTISPRSSARCGPATTAAVALPKQLGDRLEQLSERADELSGDGSGHDLDKWQRDADKLRDDLTKWSEKGQLDPAVAAQAQARIDRLASSIDG